MEKIEALGERKELEGMSASDQRVNANDHHCARTRPSRKLTVFMTTVSWKKTSFGCFELCLEL